MTELNAVVPLRAEVKRLEAELAEAQEYNDRLKSYLSGGSIEAVESELGWKRRALAAEAELAEARAGLAAYEITMQRISKEPDVPEEKIMDPQLVEDQKLAEQEQEQKRMVFVVYNIVYDKHFQLVGAFSTRELAFRWMNNQHQPGNYVYRPVEVDARANEARL